MTITENKLKKAGKNVQQTVTNETAYSKITETVTRNPKNGKVLSVDSYDVKKK